MGDFTQREKGHVCLVWRWVNVPCNVLQKKVTALWFISCWHSSQSVKRQHQNRPEVHSEKLTCICILLRKQKLPGQKRNYVTARWIVEKLKGFGQIRVQTVDTGQAASLITYLSHWPDSPQDSLSEIQHGKSISAFLQSKNETTPPPTPLIAIIFYKVPWLFQNINLNLQWYLN